MSPHVITRLCRDCVDGACVDACPVDCIYEEVADGPRELPNQLFIDPEQCICCGACEPHCPWGAIYPIDEVPEAMKADITLNERTATEPDRFDVAVSRLRKGAPTLEAVATNRAKWTA